LKRIDKYLNEEEEIEGEHALDGGPLLNNLNKAPRFVKATFAWSKSDTDDNPFVLKDLNITFIEAELNLIVGPVGSGKSSLLLALLGEMRLLGGEFHLARNDGVAYVSQIAWLQNATIRENILFGSKFEEERYWRVIRACSLNVDLDRFDARDNTEVGEKGDKPIIIVLK
jgi:ABC-type transport system involved in cytochrome bd biosynthesis fused ATPase/permease subunit